MVKSDYMVVGYDNSVNKDIPVLTVSKMVDGKLHPIKVFEGQEAIELYNQLRGE